MGKVLAVKKATGLFALTAALVLAACGNQQTSDPIVDTIKALAGGLLGGGGAVEPAEPVTRAMIESSDVPMLMALVPSRGAQALLYQVGRNRGVAIYSTADASTLSLRDGILVASRGLGNDLMSAAVPTAAQVLSGSGSHNRSYFTLDGEDQTQRADFTCVLSRHASEPVDIIERRYAVHEVKETCSSSEHAFVNRYWIDGGGSIVQSIQWLGTDVGFLQLADLSI
ncbi:YjbF family lipoprotein [Plastorhodobacter daqingensis]|uniref:YjbF family lipoprotein n=1 Tax=Plastorhodobacter daqingensis TaxID=1387281 RepID=A0ABW2UE93_9RHOB